MADHSTNNKSLTSEPERPCAFVNMNSGERSAALFVADQLKKNFGADNVLDLFPVKGKPPVIEEAKQFLIQRKPDLLVVAGGDGTVSLGFDIVDEVRAAKLVGPATAPIAVIPMGTGNDLSRSLGFGGGYKKPLVKAEERFTKVIKRLFMARPRVIDRFALTITTIDPDTVTPGHAGGVNGHRPSKQRSAPSLPKEECRSFLEERHRCSHAESAASSAEQRQQQHQQESSSPTPAQPPSSRCKETKKVFTNYFSIGFDAEVAKAFGDFRDHHPGICKSRVGNKIWYGCFGCNAMCCSSTLPKKHVSLTVDGKAIKVPSNMKSIVVSSMITYAGGNILWADSRQKFDTQAVDDGKVEVVALEGVWHMVGIGTRIRSGKKLAQGSSIVLYSPAHFTMQYDGEPIAAMGAPDQMVKIVIEFMSQSLGTEVPLEKESNRKATQASHSETERK
ncbi:putative diacylglycerol kinase-like protein [Leptomonas seymouri]|uniref:Diacylglycerol kinase n=1 Tax=Leptomonas seymouri TaxID=5684 RepID=A0A0N1PD11_LEPSE|nr:putative diacylglycerol kinase-like protein [Leptomonas seymouri]|eukprot:KPI86270.1 putative diacylglycerol kinase-like protein [Leptomonas seymouri]